MNDFEISIEKCRTCSKWHQFFFPSGYMEGYCEISNKPTLGHYDCWFGRAKIYELNGERND